VDAGLVAVPQSLADAARRDVLALARTPAGADASAWTRAAGP
jgi:hypothetical protein